MGAVARVLGKLKQCEVMTVPTAEEALQVAQQFQPCMLLVSLRGSLDGEEQLGLLKKLEKPIRAGEIKALVVSSVKRHPLARAIAEIGITDYAEEPIPVKTLLFKTNLILKAITALRKKKETPQEEARVFKSTGEADAAAALVQGKELDPKYKPALQLGEDTFVFKGAKPRKIGQSYLLQAEGPLPTTGKWELEPGEAEVKQWRWVPRADLDDSQAAGDGWVHEGELPEFDERQGKWQLKSIKPRLALRKGGKFIAAKVETDAEGNVEIAEDSRAAIDNLMLNKTLAVQARENLINEAIANQEIEKKKVAELSEVSTEKDLTPLQQKRTSDAEEKAKLRRAEREMREKAEREEREQEEREAERKRREKREARERSEDLSQVSRKAAERILRDKKRAERSAGEVGSDETGAAARDLNDLNQEEVNAREEREKFSREESDLKARELAVEPETGERPEGEKAAIGEKKPKAEKGAARSTEESDASEQQSAERVEAEDGHSGRDKKTREAEASTERTRSASAKAERRARERISQLKQQNEEEGIHESESEISPEEEEALRHGLEKSGEREVAPGVLRLRARMEKRKERNRQIREIEDSLKGEGLPLEALFPEEEHEEAPSDSPANLEEKERKFRAIESIDEESAEGFFGSKKKKDEEKAKPESSSLFGEVFYLDRAEVLPEDGSWEKEGKARTYLPNSVFVDGFKNASELLPLWVFEGRYEPELLEVEAKWKFVGLAPRLVSELKDLPKSLKELLLNLRKQAQLSRGEIPSESPLEEESSEERSNVERQSDSADKNKQSEVAPFLDIDALERAAKRLAEKNKSVAKPEIAEQVSQDEEEKRLEREHGLEAEVEATAQREKKEEAENRRSDAESESGESERKDDSEVTEKTPSGLSAFELLVLVAISDSKRTNAAPGAAINVSLRLLENAWPGFRCGWREEPEIGPRVLVGELRLALPVGRTELTSREQEVAQKFVEALAELEPASAESQSA